MHRLLAVMLTLGLGACGNTVASLHSVPAGAVQVAAAPTIGAVTATDQRKEEPRRLATIMGGFGNPLKTLDTAKPVKDEVADVVVIADLQRLCEIVLNRAVNGLLDKPAFRAAVARTSAGG